MTAAHDDNDRASAGMVSDERIGSLRKQLRHRAHGESRDENDEKAQELSDLADICDELISRRASLERLREAQSDATPSGAQAGLGEVPLTFQEQTQLFPALLKLNDKVCVAYPGYKEALAEVNSELLSRRPSATAPAQVGLTEGEREECLRCYNNLGPVFADYGLSPNASDAAKARTIEETQALLLRLGSSVAPGMTAEQREACEAGANALLLRCQQTTNDSAWGRYAAQAATLRALASRAVDSEGDARDAARYRWIEAQRGNLFTPGLSFRATGWAWFGDDGKRLDGATLGELIDSQLSPPAPSERGVCATCGGQHPAGCCAQDGLD